MPVPSRIWIDHQPYDVLGFRRLSLAAAKLAHKNGGKFRAYGSGYIIVVPGNVKPEFRTPPTAAVETEPDETPETTYASVAERIAP